MPVLGLHVDSDQLEDEAEHTIHASGNIEVVFLSIFLSAADLILQGAYYFHDIY